MAAAARSASDRPVRATTSTSAAAVSIPSPVVAWSAKITCPLCSPPSARLLRGERLQHVPIADVGGDHVDARLAHRQVEAEVRHRRDDDRVVAERTAFEHVDRADRDDVVAVDDRAVMVDGDQPVGVAVEGDAQIGAVVAHRVAERLRSGRPDTVVDVRAVRGRRR